MFSFLHVESPVDVMQRKYTGKTQTKLEVLLRGFMAQILKGLIYRALQGITKCDVNPSLIY